MRLLHAGLYALGQLIWPDSNEATYPQTSGCNPGERSHSLMCDPVRTGGFAYQFIAGNEPSLPRTK